MLDQLHKQKGLVGEPQVQASGTSLDNLVGSEEREIFFVVGSCLSVSQVHFENLNHLILSTKQDNCSLHHPAFVLEEERVNSDDETCSVCLLLIPGYLHFHNNTKQ